MIVRALDAEHEWTFGRGKNNYLTGNPAIGQMIRTRLLSFLGDCFFDLEAGIDWWERLGGKSQPALNFDIKSVIINTEGVVGIEEESQVYDPVTRLYAPIYSVTTIIEGNINTGQFLGNLLTEIGDLLTTEDGEPIEA